MDFEHFAPARDFLYLAAMLLGAGVGCILNRFRRGSTPRFRNLTVTAGICFFSAALAALTASSIYSNWMIFTETTLYLPLGILALIPALVFRFPRTVGFPLFLVSSVFVVWMGYVYLRFPVIDSTGWGKVIRTGDGSVQISLPSIPEQELNASFSLQPTGEDTALEFRALRISVSRIFPLVGGISRGVIMTIRKNDELLYINARLNRGVFPGLSFRPGAEPREIRGWFFSFQELLGKLDIKDLQPGVGRIVLFENSALAFR